LAGLRRVVFELAAKEKLEEKEKVPFGKLAKIKRRTDEKEFGAVII